MSLLQFAVLFSSRSRTAIPRCRRQLVPVEALEVRTLLAGEFTDLGAIGLTSVHFSSVAWGDMDNDGDLDALVTGRDSTDTKIARIYRNNGNNTFTDLNIGLAGVDRSAVAWGDSDNDGDLDILLSGSDSNNAPVAKVYRNNRNGTFSDMNVGLTGVLDSSAAWGDADNDGDLDIVLCGEDSTNTRTTTLYRNNGNGMFTDLNTGLTGVYRGSVAWGDADRDGDLDILLTGRDNTEAPVAQIYRNNGDSTFTDLNAGLTGVFWSSAAWGDSDNDGDLDLVIAGWNGPDQIAKVYRNNGNSTFTDISAGLTGVMFSSAAWGDMDNDGDLDLLLAGADPHFDAIAKVYRNNGNDTFTDISAGLTGIMLGSVAWGDSDSDGDLDLLLTGRDGNSNPMTKVYRNNAATANTPPTVPTGLSASADNTAMTLAWTAASDAQTPAAGLSYNLRVGITPGNSDVFSTMANTVNGIRRLPDAGPIQGTSYTLHNLMQGTRYYWSVQAIDPAFTGGMFAAEQSFYVNTPPTIGGVIANQPLNDNATLSPFTTLTVTDADNQNMFARVTILNGVFRGDFTPASVSGWTRSVSGNNLIYSRFYNPQPNIGSVVQAALRGLVYVPRANAIKPNSSELTDIQVFINDGIANTTTTSRLTTTSVNDAPTFGGTAANPSVNDNATVNPFTALTVSDVDTQEMLISVTILNGTVRGDFTPASTAGWAVRYVLGNNITYKRYFSPQANVGAAAQAAFRALVFQPRQNAINPGTTEATDFQVTVSDGVAPAVLGTGTRVTSTSVNNAPTIGGAVAGQTMNDNQTKAVFSTLTVTDPDTQAMNVIITIPNGVSRGDFTAGSTTGWTRTVVGVDLRYNRFFNATANIGATVQTAIRALVFQPRTNIPVSTTETTGFTVFLNDGLANTTNSTSSVITTGVAPSALLPDRDVNTVIVPKIAKLRMSPLARLLKKAR